MTKIKMIILLRSRLFRNATEWFCFHNCWMTKMKQKNAHPYFSLNTLALHSGILHKTVHVLSDITLNTPHAHCTDAYHLLVVYEAIDMYSITYSPHSIFAQREERELISSSLFLPYRLAASGNLFYWVMSPVGHRVTKQVTMRTMLRVHWKHLYLRYAHDVTVNVT